MLLRFANDRDRRQADALMQPALIRIVENLRKQLEQSEWQGQYQETQLWPPTATEADIHQVKTLQDQLTAATAAEAEQIQAQLAQLPTPFPGYELHLEKGEQVRIVDVWELCCCVCFQTFPCGEEPVVIDPSLWDPELQDVDWLHLDNKAKGLVTDVFQALDSKP